MDFDIDSVTLLTVDINPQGKYELWSPFGTSIEEKALNASKKLPLPNNKTLDSEKARLLTLTSSEYEEIRDSLDRNDQKIVVVDNANSNLAFFEKYKELLNFKPSKEGNLLLVVKPKKPKFSRNPERLLTLINELLREKNIPFPNISPNRANDSDTTLETINLKNAILKSLNESLNDLKEPLLISVTDVEEIFDLFVDIINQHNTYFQNKKLVSSSKLHRMTNNSNHHCMYNIITDTANLVLSMTSVDDVASKVKDLSKTTKKAINDLFTGAGNFYAFGEMISNNYTGKDCIAKSAATIKTFFKLSHFFNTILNSGDPELLKLLEVRLDVWDACGEYKPLLSGIRAVDPNRIVNNNAVLRMLTALEEGRLNDAGGELSALLGLSADNAKELVLAKINAGIDLIGLYLYGISIGFNITTLLKLLTSPTVDVLQGVMKSDVFSDVNELTIDKVFNYLLYGPAARIGTYHNVVITKKSSKYSPVIRLIHALSNHVNLEYTIKDSNNKSQNYLLKIKDWVDKLQLVKLGKNQIALALVLAILGFKAKNNIKGIEKVLLDFINNTTLTEEEIPIYNEAVNFIKEFANLNAKVFPTIKGGATPEFKALKVLSIGSQSMQMIGSIVSLNQGLKNTETDIFKKISVIEDYLIKLNELINSLIPGKKKKKIPKISLTLFIFDPSYRKNAVNYAESLKVNFNLLALIDLLPDIRGYVKGMALHDFFFKLRSGRYNYVRDNTEVLSEKYNIPTDVITPGLSNFILGIYIKEYLKDVSRKGFRFGRDKQSLDSPNGIALFKEYMEKEVIPYLKRKDPSNDFIKALKASSRNNTVSRNEITVYTLPIDMTASEDSNDYKWFIRYKEAFDNITFPTENGENVRELFFYYTLTAHEWKHSRNSLRKLFEDLKVPQVDNYYTFIKLIDNANTLEKLAEVYDLDLPAYIASHSRFKHPNAEYIYVFNKSTERFELWKKKKELTDDEIEVLILQGQDPSGDEDIPTRGFTVHGYKKYGTNFDSVNNTLGTMVETSEDFYNNINSEPEIINDDLGIFQIIYDRNKITQVLITDKEKTLPIFDINNEELYKNFSMFIKLGDGKELFDLDAFKEYIGLSSETEDEVCSVPF